MGRYRWHAPGDVNAFFGLAVDNLTQLVILPGLLVGVFGFPADLVLYRIVPGTAFGVLVGDLVSLLVGLIPEAAVAPILIFIGLEITAQAFLATPARHAPAVAMARLPVIAALLTIEIGGVLAALGRTAQDVGGAAGRSLETIRVLGNGFILSALLWGSGIALIIDRRLAAAAGVFAVASMACLPGVNHSPLVSGGLFWPGSLESAWPGRLAGGSGLLAALLAGLAPWTPEAAEREAT
ncbi:MAG: hypothetical protein ACREMB_00695 [Candidatus Rokuibacteriota bacterium]